jgi:hypothetical protein
MARGVNNTPMPRLSASAIGAPAAVNPRVARGVHVRRTTAKRRREFSNAQADAALEQRAIAQRTAAEVVHQIAGLPVTESATIDHQGHELLVEVAFAGARSGRLTVGFSRGLTRQVGAAMAAMVNLDGHPLNPVEAAKDLTSALAHAVLGAIFGVEARPRMQAPQATTPRQFGAQASVLGVADGQLVIDLQLDQSRL